MSKVDIVIVNWNAGVQLRECVESIFAYEDEALGSITIVDNASRDGSADFARGHPRIRLIEPGSNLGFGTACNLGAADGVADYVLFLNPDTRLLRPTLRAVATFMDAPGAAAIGVCGVRLVRKDGRTSRHCSQIPSPATLVHLSIGLPKVLPGMFPPLELTQFDHLSDAYVPHVMGAFYMIRRTLFDVLNGFDEAFFVYYEDLDLSVRVKDAGYKIRYLAGLSVYHKTGGTSSGAKAKALSYLLESRLRYARKHFSTAAWVLVAVAIFAIEPVRRIAHAIITGSWMMAVETVGAYRRLWTAMRGRTIDRR